jgi:uncharacterized coiled-coil protein SlyX
MSILQKIKAKLAAIQQSKNKQKLELDHLEKKLQQLQQEEASTQDHLTWSNKSMLKFWLFGLLVVGL